MKFYNNPASEAFAGAPQTSTRVLGVGDNSIAQSFANALDGHGVVISEPKTAEFDYDDGKRPVREGNNRYKMPKLKAKAKRQARRKAQQAQRRRS